MRTDANIAGNEALKSTDGVPRPAEARRLRRLAREAAAIEVVKGIRRSGSFVPMDPDYQRPTPEQQEAEDIARMDDNPDHTVYFLYCAGHVKIGYTAQDFVNRTNIISTGMPLASTRVLGIKAGMRTERLLHKRFDAHRGIGEWFELHQELRELIITLGGAATERELLQAEAQHRCWIEQQAITLGLLQNHDEQTND